MIQQELARPLPVHRPSPFQRLLRRRRRTLAVLLVTAVATFVVALVASRAMFWSVQVIADAALAVYVGVLIRVRNASADEEMTHQALGG